VHRGGSDHLAATRLHSQIFHCLDGTHAHAAVEPSRKPVAASCKKIAGPAVQADIIDKIRGALRGFQIMLPVGIVGIADAGVHGETGIRVRSRENNRGTVLIKKVRRVLDHPSITE
jgi:hypothetical protein